MTLHHCRLILETETESGTKSCFHYLCLNVWQERVLLPEFVTYRIKIIRRFAKKLFLFSFVRVSIIIPENCLRPHIPYIIFT